MKRVKTEFRSSLSTATLNDLLLVNLLTPDIPQYDPSDAVKYWIHQSKRKPSYSQDQDAPTVGSDLDEVSFDPDIEFDNILSENAVMEFLKNMD